MTDPDAAADALWLIPDEDCEAAIFTPGPHQVVYNPLIIRNRLRARVEAHYRERERRAIRYGLDAWAFANDPDTDLVSDEDAERVYQRWLTELEED